MNFLFDWMVDWLIDYIHYVTEQHEWYWCLKLGWGTSSFSQAMINSLVVIILSVTWVATKTESGNPVYNSVYRLQECWVITYFLLWVAAMCELAMPPQNKQITVWQQFLCCISWFHPCTSHRKDYLSHSQLWCGKHSPTDGNWQLLLLTYDFGAENWGQTVPPESLNSQLF